VTIQPPFDSATARRIFMLGGSTMWGTGARDSFTIPSQVASRLHARGIENVEVVNFAQAGYNSTQEATTLLVELAKGHVPAAAVFLDGYNDVTLALKEGEPGHANGEDVQTLIDLGHRGFWEELIGLGRHSDLIQWLQAKAGGGAAGPVQKFFPAEQMCRPTAEYFRNVTRSVSGIGREYGFPTLYFLQPHHVLSRKPRTSWEEDLWHRGLLPPESVKQCMLAIDSVMEASRGRSYFRAYDLFDEDTGSVFLDDHAHVTEEAAGKVADRIVEVLVPRLQTKQR
jgi:lysophospholipase L1-like esterase